MPAQSLPPLRDVTTPPSAPPAFVPPKKRKRGGGAGAKAVALVTAGGSVGAPTFHAALQAGPPPTGPISATSPTAPRVASIITLPSTAAAAAPAPVTSPPPAASTSPSPAAPPTELMSTGGPWKPSADEAPTAAAAAAAVLPPVDATPTATVAKNPFVANDAGRGRPVAKKGGEGGQRTPPPSSGPVASAEVSSYRLSDGIACNPLILCAIAIATVAAGIGVFFATRSMTSVNGPKSTFANMPF